MKNSPKSHLNCIVTAQDDRALPQTGRHPGAGKSDYSITMVAGSNPGTG